MLHFSCWDIGWAKCILSSADASWFLIDTHLKRPMILNTMSNFHKERYLAMLQGHVIRGSEFQIVNMSRSIYIFNFSWLDVGVLCQHFDPHLCMVSIDYVACRQYACTIGKLKHKTMHEITSDVITTREFHESSIFQHACMYDALADHHVNAVPDSYALWNI